MNDSDNGQVCRIPKVSSQEFEGGWIKWEFTRTYLNVKPQEKMYHDYLRGYDSLHDFAKGYKHICSPSPTKKVTSRGQGAGVKNKIQGAGPFLSEYLRMIFKGWPHRKKVASPGQSSTDSTWWDEFKNFVSTRAHPICKRHVFLLKIQLSLQKGTDTHVQLHQPKKWLEEAAAQVSKIKSKGLDLFLTEYLRDNLQRLTPQGKNPISRPIIHR